MSSNPGSPQQIIAPLSPPQPTVQHRQQSHNQVCVNNAD
jgi:hypothetical protein